MNLIDVVGIRPSEAGMFYKAEFKSEAMTEAYYIYQIRVGAFDYSGIIIPIYE